MLVIPSAPTLCSPVALFCLGIKRYTLICHHGMPMMVLVVASFVVGYIGQIEKSLVS